MTDKDKKALIDYCWSYYSPTGLYPDMFNGDLTKSEIDGVIPSVSQFLLDVHEDVLLAGESRHREFIRDILLSIKQLDVKTNPLSLLKDPNFKPRFTDENSVEVSDLLGTERIAKYINNIPDLEHGVAVKDFFAYVKKNNLAI